MSATKEVLKAVYNERYLPATLHLKKWTALSHATKFLLKGGLTILGGTPGSAKTYLALEILLEIHNHEPMASRCVYLPLEMDRATILRRMAGIIGRTWAPMEDDPIAKHESIKRVQSELEGIEPFLAENPSMPYRPEPTPKGLQWFGSTPQAIVEFCYDAFRRIGVRCVIVDPMAAADFSGFRNPWDGEAWLIKALKNCAAETGQTIILVCHTGKMFKSREIGDTGQGSIQGSAQLARLSNCMLLLETHEPKASQVYRAGGMRTPETHNRTMHILKARDGTGGRPIALDFGREGPRMKECGVIAKRELD